MALHVNPVGIPYSELEDNRGKGRRCFARNFVNGE